MSVQEVRNAAPAALYQKPELSKELRQVLDLLYEASGKNPFYFKDPRNKRGVEAAFNRALNDSVITRDELEEILEDYYGIDEVNDEPWEAFTGGKENLSLRDLTRFLKFFMKYRRIIGYDLKYFFSLDNVIIINAKELTPALKKLGLAQLLDSYNPQVKAVLNELIKDKNISDQEWDLLATFITIRFIDKLKDDFDFDDLDLKHPLIRQLFNKYVIRWAETNEGMNEEEWDVLIEKQESIKSMEKEGYSFIDLKLTGDQERGLLDKAIELHEKNPLANANEISSILSEIKKLNQKPNKSDSLYASPVPPPPRISYAEKVEISPRK